MTNTILLVVVGIAVQFVLGLGLALVLVDELRGKRFIIPLLMLPVMMVPVVVALELAHAVGQPVRRRSIISSASSCRPRCQHPLADANAAGAVRHARHRGLAVDAVHVPDPAGRAVGVNPELYEAAALDGAGWWQQLRDITLPGIAPVIAVAMLFRALDAFKIFDLVFMFTQGATGHLDRNDLLVHLSAWLQVLPHGLCRGRFLPLVIFLTVIATLYVAPVPAGGRRERGTTGASVSAEATPAMRRSGSRAPAAADRAVRPRCATSWSGLALIFFLFPIFWIAGTSFKLPGEYLQQPAGLDSRANRHCVHYQSVMAAKGYPALKNSLIIAGSATVLSVLVGSLAAYSLARFNTGGRHLAFWLLSQRMMPPVVLVDPVLPDPARPGQDQSRAGTRLSTPR